MFLIQSSREAMEFQWTVPDWGHKQCISDEKEIEIHKSVYEANLILLWHKNSVRTKQKQSRNNNYNNSIKNSKNSTKDDINYMCFSNKC